METRTVARTRQGLPLISYRWKQGLKKVLILGGVHGDEPEGVVAAHGLLDRLQQANAYRLDITLIPVFNPEGVYLSKRTNSNGVDLNRNLPTRDWSPEIKGPRYHPGPSPCSEPENQFLVSFLTFEKPEWILSLHSWHPVLNVNGACEPQAQIIASHTGYRIDTDIGYPTPGCLGTYAGLERSSPTLTYEIERGLSFAKICSTHVPAILESLKVMEA